MVQDALLLLFGNRFLSNHLKESDHFSHTGSLSADSFELIKVDGLQFY